MKDLNLTSVQYSWCSSIFYVGQLVAEFPFIYLMSKLPLTKFVGITIVLWGIVCMCLAAPKSFAGFAAVRFLLGFTEGAVSPAFVTITSIWYQKSEHATRTGYVPIAQLVKYASNVRQPVGHDERSCPNCRLPPYVRYRQEHFAVHCSLAYVVPHLWRFNRCCRHRILHPHAQRAERRLVPERS